MKTPGKIRSRERIHKDPQIEDTAHDPYRERHKPKGAAFCPTCGAIFEQGRWQWGSHPAAAHEHVCPACHRIKDQLPAGYVNLQGPFFDSHRDEILGLLRNEEENVKKEHPLERIMSVEQEDKNTVVCTTGVHLARRFADAIHRGYKGELKMQYAPDEFRLRVYWSR
jgi:hypothetical protein